MRHPVLFHIHQRLEALKHKIRIDRRDAQPCRAAIKAFKIIHRTEHLDGTIRFAIGFQAFKNGLSIMKNHGGRVHLQGRVGNDAGVMPSLALGIVHYEHVVGENLPESELAFIGGFCFWLFRPFNCKLHANIPPVCCAFIVAFPFCGVNSYA